MGCFISNRMVDPLLQNASFNETIDPIEEEKLLLGFLGQTYQEISRYDSHIVSANPFLSPKKQEFQRLAESLVQETRLSNGRQIIQPTQQHFRSPQQLDPRPYLDTGIAPVIPPQADPNQMEFTFDNSITAKSINSKLVEMEKMIKKLDITLQKVLSYLEDNETENPKQE